MKRFCLLSFWLSIALGHAGASPEEPMHEQGAGSLGAALPTREQLWPLEPPPPLRLTALDASDGAPVVGALGKLCRRGPKDKPLATAGHGSKVCLEGFTDAVGRLEFDSFEVGLYDVLMQLDGFASTAVLDLRFGEDPHSPAEITLVMNPVCHHCYASEIAASNRDEP